MASEDEAKLLIQVTLIDPNRIIGLLVSRYERHWERNDIYRNHNLIKATPQDLDVLFLLQFVIFNGNDEAKIMYIVCQPVRPLSTSPAFEKLLSPFLPPPPPQPDGGAPLLHPYSSFVF